MVAGASLRLAERVGGDADERGAAVPGPPDGGGRGMGGGPEFAAGGVGGGLPAGDHPGVREIQSSTRTTYWRGNWDEDPQLRAEFSGLCTGRG
ncbi:MAG: hypothetical protein ACRDOL_33665 [Streptosporangiaceae bacterium]